MRGADLVVLAVKADAALATARAVADALGVDAASLRGERDRVPERLGAFPDPEARSLAERIQDVVQAPVTAGLHSIAAANLDEAPPEEDALICGDDEGAEAPLARAGREGRRRPRARRRARSRAPARWRA